MRRFALQLPTTALKAASDSQGKDRSVECATGWGGGKQGWGLRLPTPPPPPRFVVPTLTASWGCCASEAADAASALMLLHQAAQDGDPFDIAIVDKEMPDANGEETAHQIAADPRLRHTKLLL